MNAKCRQITLSQPCSITAHQRRPEVRRYALIEEPKTSQISRPVKDAPFGILSRADFDPPPLTRWLFNKHQDVQRSLPQCYRPHNPHARRKLVLLRPRIIIIGQSLSIRLHVEGLLYVLREGRMPLCIGRILTRFSSSEVHC